MNEHPLESPCLEEHFPIRDGLYVYNGSYIVQVPHLVDVCQVYKGSTPTDPPILAHSAHTGKGLSPASPIGSCCVNRPQSGL